MQQTNRMTTLIQLTKSVEIIPDLKHPDHELLRHYKEKYEKTCTKYSGFILEVHRVLRVIRRKLSAYNGNLIVDGVIEITALLPKVGLRTQAVVKQSFSQGWILFVQNCMKVFVPFTPDIVVNLNDVVDIEVIQIRFQKGRYDCIGKILVEKIKNHSF